MMNFDKNFVEQENPYIDKASGCFFNRLDISDKEQLRIAEKVFNAIRSEELNRNPIKESFDLEHLQAIHKHLFQDVYDWAGEIRQVDPPEDYIHYNDIYAKSESIFNKIARENYLQKLAFKPFTEQLGYYLSEMYETHPFMRGNESVQKIFTNQLAHKRGWHIDWDRAEKIDPLAMETACHKAVKGDYSQINKLISENIVDLDYTKAKELARNEVKEAEAGEVYNGRILGVTDYYVVQLLKDNTAIIHDRNTLLKELEPFVNQEVEISYPHGKIGLVKVKSENNLKDLNKQKDKNDSFYNYEK